MRSCLVCGEGEVETLLELGPQPVSSHYAPSPDAAVIRHDLTLAVCASCGFVQLGRPFPPEDLVPPYDWITYREPEAHLDGVVERVAALMGGRRIEAVAGVSYKDSTTVERLVSREGARGWIIDPQNDLAAGDPNANIETVHGRLDPSVARRIAERRGLADVLIVRHIAEHAGAPGQFMRSLEALLGPDGLLVVEVPDCRRNIELQDYTMLWEEHSLYPTADTFPALLTGTSFHLIDIDVHPYPFEDVLVLYARKTDDGTAAPSPVAPETAARSRSSAFSYANAFARWTDWTRAVLDRLCERGPLALYGAGHLTSAFVGLHGVADRFAFVVDDTPQKQDLYLPGSVLPIVNRERLAHSDVQTCLFGLAPEVEDKIIAKNTSFTGRGGEFHSILAASARTIRRLADVP